ncbi:core-binding factor subunit beta-like isoform X1 [Gorilla gorilla gorilla]|uniref:core-binding factor subunit beta-like isoform X1 n=1 Tax=Gorilla gorilla gorilla TaxID=9595 RepID=UPI003008E377
MPRVVPDQRSKFENEEFFRKLSRECGIKYTGFRDRPHEEPQARFQNACRDGRSEIAFVATGTNLFLQFFPASWQGEQRQTPSREYVDLEREAGKGGSTLGLCSPRSREEMRRSQSNRSIIPILSGLFSGIKRTTLQPRTKPHSSSLSRRRGADPPPRRWLYPCTALL